MRPPLTGHQRLLLRLLHHGDFTRDEQRQRWRFGTRRVEDPPVNDLISRGLAIRCGNRVTLATPIAEPTTIAPALDLENPAAKRKERA